MIRKNYEIGETIDKNNWFFLKNYFIQFNNDYSIYIAKQLLLHVNGNKNEDFIDINRDNEINMKLVIFFIFIYKKDTNDFRFLK